MNSFKNISSATASRDLQKAVEKGLLAKEGSLNQTVYMFK
jgi:Fic family protein